MRETAAANTHELQDAVLGVIRRARTPLWRWWDVDRDGASARPFDAAPARAAISGGYDLFARLLAEQRQFVDALIDQQRRCAESLLTPPDHR